MATDRLSITIQCVACPAELQMPTSARHTGNGYAEVVVNTSALRQHITEHTGLRDVEWLAALARGPERHDYASNQTYERDWHTWRALQRDSYLTPAEAEAKTQAFAELLAWRQG